MNKYTQLIKLSINIESLIFISFDCGITPVK